VAALDPLARREFLVSLTEAVTDGEVSVILSSHLLHDLDSPTDLPLANLLWGAVLRSCRAYEGYQRLYVGRIEPERVVEYLLLHRNKVHSRDELFNGVWGSDFLGDSNLIDVYIRYLRGKIDDPFSEKLVQTVRGVGYALKD